MVRLEIFVYLIGGLVFGFVALGTLGLCLIRADLSRAKAVVLQLDDAFNVSLNGKKDMKFSSRCYVEASLGSKKYKALMWVIDAAFYLTGNGKDHCKRSYLNDLD